MTNSSGDYWVYEYDEKGQVKSGKKYWATGAVVPGQHNEFAYDDIGNLATTATGGDRTGGNLRSASFTPNHLKQYTNRTVPAYVDESGLANTNATITVNGLSTYRKDE